MVSALPGGGAALKRSTFWSEVSADQQSWSVFQDKVILDCQLLGDAAKINILLRRQRKESKSWTFAVMTLR